MHRLTQALALALLTLLTALAAASCGGYARNYKEPVIAEGTVRARQLLSVEKQREFDKLYLEAICQKQNGKMDAAHELLEQALAINPNASEALYEMALMQLQLDGRQDSTLVAEGEAMLLKAVQLEPSNPYFRSALAERWVMTGHYARAARLYQQMADEKPTTETFGMLVYLYSQISDYPNALQALEQVEVLEGANQKTSLTKFYLLYEMGRVADAFGELERVSEENPQDLSYRVMLGNAYLEKGYKEKAVGVFEDVMTSDPQNIEAQTSLTRYYLGEGEYEKYEKGMTALMLNEKIENQTKFSILQEVGNGILHKQHNLTPESLVKHFAEALTLPQENSAIAQLMYVYTNSANLSDEAKGVALRTILRDEPENVEARMMLLRTYISNEQPDEIVTLCQQGAQIHPEELIYYYYGGLALVQLSRPEEAIELLEKGVEQARRNTEQKDDSAEQQANASGQVDDADYTKEILANMHGLLGESYHELGNPTKAYAHYDKALELVPDDAGCLNNYAYYLSKEGKRLDKALTMAKKVVDLEPDNATYLDTYAWVLFCKRQYPQARIYIERALEAIPDNEIDDPANDALFDHAGDIHFRCGDRSKALEYWERALQLSEDEELIRNLEKKLKNKRL